MLIKEWLLRLFVGLSMKALSTISRSAMLIEIRCICNESWLWVAGQVGKI